MLFDHEDKVAASRIGIGAGGNSAAPTNGRYGSYIHYRRALSDTEINRIGRYLGSEWGITWTDI